MRQVMMLVLLIGLGGCAAARPNAGQPTPLAPLCYANAPSAALVFDLPASIYDGTVPPPREERYPSAVVGFEETTATFFYTRTDDRMRGDRSNLPFREAVSERIGVSYR
jgi:hypothetical protein